MNSNTKTFILTEGILSGGCILKKKCLHYLQTLFSQFWWSLSTMSWGNTRMNSNGVGVVSLCFFTTIFMKAGKEVWNWSSSFCPQPSWMKINSFVQQGLKPEQRHTSQNVKLTSKREKFFLQFLGKPQSMPHVCASKKGNPQKSCESNVLQELFCQVLCSRKNPQSPSRAIPRFYGAKQRN